MRTPIRAHPSMVSDSTTTEVSTSPMTLKTAHDHRKYCFQGDDDMDVETRLQQVATVINQIDDPKVPRNIRKQAKETCENWLLNKGKNSMSASLCPSRSLKSYTRTRTFHPNLERHSYINTELEKILQTFVITPSSSKP